MPTSIRWKFPVTMAAEEKAVAKALKRIGKFYVARFGPSPSMLASRTLFALDARCALARIGPRPAFGQWRAHSRSDCRVPRDETELFLGDLCPGRIPRASPHSLPTASS